MTRYFFVKIINIAIFICLVIILSLILTGGYSFYLGPLKIEFINFIHPISVLSGLVVLKLLFDPQIGLFFTRKGIGIDLQGNKIDLKGRLGETGNITYVRSLIKAGFQTLQKVFYSIQKGFYNFYSQRKEKIFKVYKILGILALFASLTVLMTYPLVFKLGSHLPDTLYEPLLNTWLLAWDVRQISTDPLNLFNANIFYPHEKVLAYSEHLIGSSLLAMPIILLTDNAIMAYNFVFLLSFCISAVAIYLLVRYLTGHTWSAIIAALIFAFCPFRFSHLSQLQVLTIQWLPLIFLYLHKYMAGARYRHLILFMIFYILQALSCGYYILFTTFFMVIFLLINIKRGSFAWQNLVSLILLVLLIPTLLCPFIYPYIEVRRDWEFHRSREEVILFSAHLNGYFRVPGTNKAYKTFLAAPTNNIENNLFPGYICLFLAALSIAGAIYRIQDTEHRRQAPVFCFLLPVSFYIVMAILAFFLSLGPLIHISRSMAFWGPYSLLYDFVPGFDALRAPARLGLFVIFALSILAGFGSRFIFETTAFKKKGLIFFMLSSLILIEYWSAPIPTAPVKASDEIPPVYQWLAKQGGDFAIIELPITLPSQEILYAYYSIYHWKKLVNGFSGYYPPLYYFYLRDRAALFPGLDFIRDLQSLGIKYLIWHSDLYPAGQRERIKPQIAQLGSTLRLVRQFYTDYVYAIDPGPLPTPPDSFTMLDKTGWQVEASRFNNESLKAIDGILDTYWSTQEPQRPGTYFLVDLGSEYQINGVRVHLGQNVAEYPRGYTLGISTNNEGWKLIKEEREPLPPLLSYARQPKDPIFEIYFPVRKARYLKITLMGTHQQYRWTIHELEVLSPAKSVN